MKKILTILITGLTLMFLGCAQQGLPEVSANSTNRVLRYETGVILSVKAVAVKDNGTGTFIGSLVGAVLGSTVGRGRGSVLASLAGGLGGAYVGNEVGKANAQELTIQLDDSGENIVVITKGTKHYVGEHVRVVKNGGRVVGVEAYQ